MSEEGDWIGRLTDFGAQIGPYIEAKCDKAVDEAAKAISKFTGESAARQIVELWSRVRERLASGTLGKAVLDEIATSLEDRENLDVLKGQIRKPLKNSTRSPKFPETGAVLFPMALQSFQCSASAYLERAGILFRHPQMQI